METLLNMTINDSNLKERKERKREQYNLIFLISGRYWSYHLPNVTNT